jgi:hypothetical protein
VGLSVPSTNEAPVLLNVNETVRLVLILWVGGPALTTMGLRVMIVTASAVSDDVTARGENEMVTVATLLAVLTSASMPPSTADLKRLALR